jgi:hypothetical protein
VGRVQQWRLARTLAGVVPKRELARAELAPAWISVAAAPCDEPRLADGSYALALVDSVLYLARTDGDGAPSARHHLRLRLADVQLAMAFGGPPFHSTLHLEHPAVGRLVMSLDALRFATQTEAAVSRVQATGAW